MVDTFIALLDDTSKTRPYRRELLEALSTAIPALPRDAFAGVADRVFALAKAEKFWDRYPALYLRAADVGPAALPLYRDHVMAGKVRGYLRILPVLAICRIGQADPELRDRLKAEFTGLATEKSSHNDEQYLEALFVALLKLGETEFVTGQLGAVKPRQLAWFEAVLAGKGQTATGPNNCMGSSWPSTAFLGAAMAPGLKRQQGGWAGG